MAPVRRIFVLLGTLCFAPPVWAQQNLHYDRPAQVSLEASPQLSPISIKNGVLRKKRGQDAIATLRIETPISADYLLKLVNAHTGAEEMVIYVARNSKYETKVPLGTYKIRGAFGTTWYGEKHLFGPDTAYFRLVQKDNKNDQFTFRRLGNQVNGYAIRLIQQVAGNLETPAIGAQEF